MLQIVKLKNPLLFEVLYDRFSEGVYNKCHSFATDEDEAKDLTQDVFLKLYMQLNRFSGKSKFKTWIYAFTYNYCVNYVSRDTAKKMQQQSVQIEDSDYLLIDADDETFDQLQLDKLEKCLEEIPIEDKALLLLKYQDDASIREIAEGLDIGESAAKMRLKRAKGRLLKTYNNKI